MLARFGLRRCRGRHARSIHTSSVQKRWSPTTTTVVGGIIGVVGVGSWVAVSGRPVAWTRLVHAEAARRSEVDDGENVAGSRSPKEEQDDSWTKLRDMLVQIKSQVDQKIQGKQGQPASKETKGQDNVDPSDQGKKKKAWEDLLSGKHSDIANLVAELSAAMPDLSLNDLKSLNLPSHLSNVSIDNLTSDLVHDIQAAVTAQLPDLEELQSTVASQVSDLQSLPSSVASKISDLPDVHELWTAATDKAMEALMEGTAWKDMQAYVADADRNPEMDWVAKVRRGNWVGEDEQRWLDGRREATRKAVEDIVGEPVDERDMPVIGIAASGGGVRAMLTTLAVLSTLHDSRILSCTSYLAGVSGSTWAMAQLYTLGPDFGVIQRRVEDQLCENYLSVGSLVRAIRDEEGGVKVLAGVAQKYFAATVAASSIAANDDTAQTGPKPTTDNSVLRTVDLFGTLLTARLLLPDIPPNLSLKQSHDAQTNPVPDRTKLSFQRHVMEGFRLPLPIYTAVSQRSGVELDLLASSKTPSPKATDSAAPPQEKQETFTHKGDQGPYQWHEFTPFEAGHASTDDNGFETGAWCPIWAYGRIFDHKGESADRVPELSLGLLLGTCGSAFTATITHIAHELLPLIPPLLHSHITHLLPQTSSTIHPIAPATFPSLTPTPESPADALMDAGMDNNVPFIPLLRPGRDCDVVIVVDASMERGIRPWIERGQINVKESAWGSQVRYPDLPPPDTPESTRAETSPCTILTSYNNKASSSANAQRDLTIVYLPLTSTPTFAPTAPYCRTTNFTYTPEETRTVMTSVQGTTHDSIGDIKHAIRRVVGEKRRRREREERNAVDKVVEALV
ncbi:acyl transferase/acyl hydrolase/lysophospholipase [Phlyctochytrium arcticum]|nr:acyl transferase/acyl hydrolase/lysophospholipase [Phlyctochytrium arcticum]